jgi:hypothetical protein
MKKHLLLGSALLAAISAFPQTASFVNRSPRSFNMADKIARKFAMINAMENAPASSGSASSSGATTPALPPSEGERSSQLVFSTWSKFTGSMNIYGMLVSNSRPLQYHDNLNAVTFVHRKSNSYAASPTPATTGAATGVLVCQVSTNLGATWDSTAVWNDNNNWARYPQGAILNPPLNTALSSASIVVAAPITQANTNLGWIGSGFSVKQLGAGNYNNIAPAANMTFVANTSPYGMLGRKVDFPRLDMSSCDNGVVWGLGQIFDGSVNATTAAGQGFRGARLVKTEFVSGSIVWSTDSIIPDVRVSSVTGSLVSASPGMAWSEDGQTGYVWHIGSTSAVPQNSVGTNSGFQPIVWKTTNGGALWTLEPSIDFNQPAFATQVLNHVVGTNDGVTTIPFFNSSEGISGTVDRNGSLHLVSLILASFSPDADSSAFISQFNNYDGERYNYPHTPGIRPYVYDFTLSNGNWGVTTIDSLSSEGPGTRSTDDGYAFNPWDATGGTGTDKVEVDARIQVSRTADGSKLVYTWAETDSSITVGGNKKWNIFPNVHARLMEISANGTMTLSATEVIATRLSATQGGNPNPNVSNRGYNFYAASHCAVNALGTNLDTLTVDLPMTVSNSPAQLEQLNPVNHWYSKAALQFKRSGTDPGTITAVPDKNQSVAGSVIFPNPAKTNAMLSIDLKSNSNVDITVVNMVGQTVKATKAEGQVGANNINIDLNGLAKGIYMVTVKADNASNTKKLVIE